MNNVVSMAEVAKSENRAARSSWGSTPWAESLEKEAEIVLGPRPSDIMSDIMWAVSQHTGVAVIQIIGVSRVPRIALARQFAMWKMKQAGHSTVEIGVFMKRHHTTVMHAIVRIDKMMATGE